jgi:Mrp family chromosome partitioning ATPase
MNGKVLANRDFGVIVTFYSYKGGVGRTFALVNVAAQLAMWGYRVLCVDWDLEAPGLDSVFNDCYNSIPDDSPRKAGLVGIIGGLTGKIEIAHDEVHEIMAPAIASYSPHVDEAWNLDILFAGPVHRLDYAQRVTSIDWNRLYAKSNLGRKLEAWRAWTRARYDFVFVDSRTGFSDTGSICTMHLPDILVVLFTSSDQSRAGAIRAASRAVEGKRRYYYSEGKLRVVPLLSRIDLRSRDKSAAWSQQTIADGRLDQFYYDWLSARVAPLDMLNATRIPYVVDYAFGEPLAVAEERPYFVAEVCQDPGLLTYTIQNIAALLKHDLGRSRELIYNRQGFIESAINVARSTLTAYEETNDELQFENAHRRIKPLSREEGKAVRVYEMLLLKLELVVSEARWLDAGRLMSEINEQRLEMNLPPVASPQEFGQQVMSESRIAGELALAKSYRELLVGLLRGLAPEGVKRAQTDP